MSAFVVEDQVINRVISHIVGVNRYSDIGRVISAEIGCNLTTDEGCTELGNAMFALNCNAIEQRYGIGQASDFRALDYQYKYELVKIMQAYKSLRCWLYQCSEGDVPDTSLLFATMQSASLTANGLTAGKPASIPRPPQALALTGRGFSFSPAT